MLESIGEQFFEVKLSGNVCTAMDVGFCFQMTQQYGFGKQSVKFKVRFAVVADNTEKL